MNCMNTKCCKLSEIPDFNTPQKVIDYCLDNGYDIIINDYLENKTEFKLNTLFNWWEELSFYKVFNGPVFA